MKKRTFAAVVILAAFNLSWFAATAETKKDSFPRLPGAVLLFGYPPYDLTVTIGDKTQQLQSGGGDWYLESSISADGRVIASARPIPGGAPAARPRFMVSTYSMTETKWTEYKELEVFDGAIAISPDGSKLAYVARDGTGSHSHLHIFDTTTGKNTVGPEQSENFGAAISWSPDGRHIAFDNEVGRGKVIPPLKGIFILDVEAGTVSKIADGASPSWSPSGEWIAFHDYSPNRDNSGVGRYASNPNRVRLIRPNGTGSKVLATFPGDEDLRFAPVWSPDSKAILINKTRDEGGRMNIYQLDLATLKLTRKFKNTPPVYGWAAAK